MKKFLLGFVALAWVVLFMTACQKDNNIDTTTTDLAVITSEDISDIESFTQNAEDETDMDLENGPAGGPNGTCPTITYSATRGTFPQTITIDFGSSCTDRNGRIRKGKIIINFSDTLSKLNATKSVMYNSYSIDSIKIEGTRTWKNTGPNSSGQPTYTRTATDMKMTYGNGETITWTASHIVTRTQGYLTRTPLDDIWSVSGNCSGVNRKGKSYSSVIDIPIVHKAICPWIVSGKRSITVDGQMRSLDYGYGGGNCDRQALLTKADGSTLIVLIHR
jgi:hypothetical protein